MPHTPRHLFSFTTSLGGRIGWVTGQKSSWKICGWVETWSEMCLVGLQYLTITSHWFPYFHPALNPFNSSIYFQFPILLDLGPPWSRALVEEKLFSIFSSVRKHLCNLYNFFFIWVWREPFSWHVMGNLPSPSPLFLTYILKGDHGNESFRNLFKWFWNVTLPNT